MPANIYNVGFISSTLAFVFTLAYVVVQLLQVIGLLQYPWDEIFVYGTSLGIVIPFLLAMLSLYYTTPDDKKFWIHAALIFAVIYGVFVTANYVVQLATVIPMTMQGQLEKVRVLQQTPHSMFWNFDAIGYIFMGLATLVALPAFERQGFQKWVRRTFLAHALVTPLIAVVYFYPTYSYRLLLLGFPWAVTAPLFMVMLALLFRKNNRAEHDSKLQQVGVAISLPQDVTKELESIL